jgi:regulator of sigma E protease
LLHTLDIIAKVLFVIVFFGLCIFIHELGHLLVALWQKLYVEKFSLGFGKKIWGTTINGVEYIISMLPFGGYVALPQLDPSDEPKTSDGTPLPSGPPVARMLTALAGPLANVLFGFFLGLFIWWFGAWEPVSQTKCEVLSSRPPPLPKRPGRYRRDPRRGRREG